MVFWQQTCLNFDNRFGIMKFLAGRRQETKTASKDPDTNGEEVVLTHTSHLREFNLCHFFQLAEAIKSPKPPISFFFQTKKWDFQPFLGILGILGLQFFASTIITIRCRRCGAEKPSEAELAAAGPVRANVSPDGRPMRPGDWICPICADHVFAKNEQCRKCGPGNTDGPWERWATGPAMGAMGCRLDAGMGTMGWDWIWARWGRPKRWFTSNNWMVYNGVRLIVETWTCHDKTFVGALAPPFLSLVFACDVTSGLWWWTKHS